MIFDASDVDDMVIDKREGWRASPEKARRRLRRYARLLTSRLIVDGEFDIEDTGGDEPDGADLIWLKGARDDG